MKVIIFDFDGTIADSFATVVEILHHLTHRTQLVTPEEIVELRQKRLLDVAKAEKIPKWRIPFLLIRGRRMMSKQIDKVQLFGGMEATIKGLSESGHTLFIMSSNSTSNVEQFLRTNKLERYFKKVYGGVGLLKKGKALKRIIEQNHIGVADCIYIGDEPRDIEGAHDAGVACIAVSWGFNAAPLLEDHHPLTVVDTPEKLLSFMTAKK